MSMHAGLQRRVQRYGWDKAASFYEKYWKDALRPAQELLLEQASPETGERILDVACGTGLVTLRLAEAVGPSGRVVGTDLSDAMVAAATVAAGQRALSNVNFTRGDAESLDFPDASFDAVVCALGLMYVPDPGQALREMYRVLAPGGRCVVAVWGRRDRCGWADIFPIVDARVKSEVCPMFFQLGGEQVLESALGAAGFGAIQTTRITTTLDYEQADDACGAAFVGGPVAMAYSRFDEPTRSEVYAEYLQSIAPYRTDAGYRIPGEFVVARGVAG